MPNPWDRGTAKALESLGFRALGTSSAALSFTMGVADRVGSLSVEETLTNVREIVSATTLPVSADFQDGFSDDLDGVAANVTRCIETGVAGLSIEDATGNEGTPLHPKKHAVERVRAARAAIDRAGVPVVLTARCEAWLVGDAHPFDTVMDRLAAYAEAGADCLYAPGVVDPSEIQRIVSSLRPRAVNVLVASSTSGFSVARLAGLGVRRISVGSALARVAWKAMMEASRSIAETATFEDLNPASFAEVEQALGASTPR
jgi:2-methylisocitrate lyase-like PEP mutase family enzyme